MKYTNSSESIALKEEELYNRFQSRHGPPLQEGEKVWLFTPAVPRGDSRKLHRPWTGPYKVLKKLSEVNYRIQHLQNYKKRVVHFDRLKPSLHSQASAGLSVLLDETLLTNIPPVEPNVLTAHATDETGTGRGFWNNRLHRRQRQI